MMTFNRLKLNRSFIMVGDIYGSINDIMVYDEETEEVVGIWKDGCVK